MPGASEMERVVAALKTLAIQPWPDNARPVQKWNDIAKTLPGIGYEAFFHAHRLAMRMLFQPAGLDVSAVDQLCERGFAVVVDSLHGEAAACVRIEVGLAWLDLARRPPERQAGIGMYELDEDDGPC